MQLVEGQQIALSLDQEQELRPGGVRFLMAEGRKGDRSSRVPGAMRGAAMQATGSGYRDPRQENPYTPSVCPVPDAGTLESLLGYGRRLPGDEQDRGTQSCWPVYARVGETLLKPMVLCGLT